MSSLITESGAAKNRALGSARLVCDPTPRHRHCERVYPGAERLYPGGEPAVKRLDLSAKLSVEPINFGVKPSTELGVE